MTAAGAEVTRRRGLRVLLLAAFPALAALLLPAAPASAASSPAAEKGVGAISTESILTVGVHESIRAGQHPVRGPSQLQLVSGHCVAAEGEAGALARLPQDVGVSPTAPRALPLSRAISRSGSQNAFLQSRIGELEEQGATAFRVNQQQVDINGVRVGINRPDLQYTLNGQRFYEEFETSSIEDAWAHMGRIMANDPSGQFLPWFVP